jgi:hypothetical protein
MYEVKIYVYQKKFWIHISIYLTQGKQSSCTTKKANVSALSRAQR